MTTSRFERPRPTGLVGWLASTDHKRIALLQLGAFGFVFFVAAGSLALLMRTELAEPGMQIVSRDELQRAVHDARLAG